MQDVEVVMLNFFVCLFRIFPHMRGKERDNPEKRAVSAVRKCLAADLSRDQLALFCSVARSSIIKSLPQQPN
jgi:hypothetical protein